MNKLFKAANLRRTILAAVLLAALVPAGGCSGVQERRWSEEVVLDDGSVVVVNRYVKFQPSNSVAGDAYSATDLETRLSFEGEFSDLPAWTEPLEPLLLYRQPSSDEWIIVATTSSCDVWSARGSPFAPYWEFRARRGERNWSQAAVSSFSSGRKSNLFFMYDQPLSMERITQKMKEQVVQRDTVHPSYLGIRTDLRANCIPRD